MKTFTLFSALALAFLALTKASAVSSRPSTRGLYRLSATDRKPHVKAFYDKLSNDETDLFGDRDRLLFTTYILLTSAGNDTTAKSKLLLPAAQRYDLELVQELLALGADTSVCEWDLQKPLHLAVKRGDPEIVEILLRYGANPNAMDLKKDTPVHLAITSGNAEIIKMLINAVDYQSRTPLHFAAVHGNEDFVKVLLRYGANPNADDDTKQTPLHLAAISGEASVVKVLLKSGANPNAEDGQKLKPIDFAVNEDIIGVLRKHGANSDGVDC